MPISSQNARLEFVEIDERDTPYFQYLNAMPRQRPAREETSTTTVVPDAKPSKNSIFEVSHTVFKPATKMNDEELALLKKGTAGVIGQDAAVQPGEMVILSPTISKPSVDTILSVEMARQASLPPSPSINVAIDDLKSNDPIDITLIPTKKNLLGQGRYSNVYLATYRNRNQNQENGTVIPQPCAIKRMHPVPEAQANGKAEAIMLNYLSECPNIVQVVDIQDETALVASADDMPSIVLEERILIILEYLPNGSLWDWSQTHPSQLTMEIWTRWARQLADALKFIHQAGVIHHDIKPHNILICDFGNAAHVPEVGTLSISPLVVSAYSSRGPSPKRGKIVQSYSPIQPGLPVSSFSQSLTDGLGKGTLAYTAPEMFDTPVAVYSFPIDLYSLGVTLYTLISGIEPFSKASSSARILFGIKRGFFESEMQDSKSELKDGAGGVFGDPMDGNWQFLSGEPVPRWIVDLIFAMVTKSPEARPTAVQLLQRLESCFKCE